MATTCPECERALNLNGGARLSEIVACPECGSELEIVSTSPVMVVVASEPEEDWGE